MENNMPDNKKKKDTLNLDTQILDNIENSYDGSSCSHGKGAGCASAPLKFDKSMPPHEFLKLSKDELMKALENMLIARRSDEKHLMLVKQGKSFFHSTLSTL